MDRKKRLLGSLLLVFVLVLVAAPSAGAGEWKARWKLATLAPDGVGWARQIKAIVLPAVEKVCQGNLEIKVYWGGVMGDDEDYIKKMRIDQLQGAGLSGQGVTLAVPEMSVVELPFLFNDWEEVDYIKSKMSETFDTIAKKNGYMVIAWIDQDFDKFYSTKIDLSNPKQYGEVKLLSWFGPIEAETAKAMGMTPVPINMPEAPAALRQRVGNTIIAPAAWMVGTQLYSVVKYVSPLNIRYAPALILVTWKRWETMPENYRKEYFAQRAGVMNKFCAEVRKDNTRCLKAMKEYGLSEAPVSKKTDDALIRVTRPLYDKLAGQLYPRELLDELLAHLNTYREKGSGNKK